MCPTLGGCVLLWETTNRCTCCSLGLGFFPLAISVHPSPLELSEVVHHVLGTCWAHVCAGVSAPCGASPCFACIGGLSRQKSYVTTKRLFQGARTLPIFGQL